MLESENVGAISDGFAGLFSQFGRIPTSLKFAIGPPECNWGRTWQCKDWGGLCWMGTMLVTPNVLYQNSTKKKELCSSEEN
jgi:hypothetical protein